MRRLRPDFLRIIVVIMCVVLLAVNAQKSTRRGDAQSNDSEESVDHEVLESLPSTDATTEEPPEGGGARDDVGAAAPETAAASTTPPATMTGLLSAEEADEIFHSNYNSTNEVDLVFVLDRSGSVPRAKWNATVQFVMNVLEHFTIDKDNTRVAVITYSTTVNVDFDDLEPNTAADKETKCTVFQRLESIITRKLPHGYTATYDALVSVYKSLLNSRPRAKKAVVVVTDGKSNIGPPPLKAAVDILSLRWQQVWCQDQYGPQVEIFAFGVEELNMPELKSIASSVQNHVFVLSAFRQFARFAQKIHGGTQQMGWALTRVFHCGGMCNGPHMFCVCGTAAGRYACVCDKGYEMRGTACEPCSVGSYKESRSPDECVFCPENMTTKGAGATSPSDCVLKPGYVVCMDLPDVEHASKFYVEGTSLDEVPNTGIPCTRVTDGNSCHYSCSVGYRLTGSPVMACNYSGVWEGVIPSCKIIDCHRIENFYEQWVGMTVNYLNSSTKYNSMVEVSCRDGTVPNNGESSWTCDSQGQWSSSWNFHCQEVFCDPLIPLNYVRVSPDICQKNRVSLGTHCRMHCAEGFQQIGPTDFQCIYENGTPQWTPKANPECRDVLPPKIVCPNKVEVHVSDYGHNSTIIYYDRNKPFMSDNSGEVKLKIYGAPEDKQFFIGNTTLIYEATDAAGNQATCMRNINVKGRSVVVKSCPMNITATVTSLRRTSQVTWPDPVFLGPEDRPLPFSCNLRNGHEFLFGVYLVSCFPNSHPGITCAFQINMTDPPCPVPFEDRSPTNGALICGTSSLYPKICRIHCREGYELPKYDARHRFYCNWDGTWNLEGEGWPECMKSRRSSKVLTENELYIRFSGVCHENHEKIIEKFNDTIHRVLESEYGPCSSNHHCRIEDIRVQCGRHASKRDIGQLSDGKSDLFMLHSKSRIKRGVAGNFSTSTKESNNALNVSLRFQLSVEALNRKSFAVTRTDQLKLLHTLDEIFHNISDSAVAGELKYKIGNAVAEAAAMREFRRRFKAIHCSKTEIQARDDLSTICYTCGPGSYHVNGSCELCPIGTYQPREGGSNCHLCPADTSTKYVGAKVLADCVGPCSPGHFSESGLESCEPCVKGTFQENPGARECRKCPDNTNTLSVGSTSVTECFEFVDCEYHQVQCIGGTCFQKDKAGVVECFCPEETSSCQEVTSHSSLAASCLNNGAYIHLDNDHFSCRCPPGYFGTFCESKLLACDSLPCQNGGSCVDLINYFICQCPVGYTGELCESQRLEQTSVGVIPFCFKTGECNYQIEGYSNPDFDLVFSSLSKKSDAPIRWVLSKSLASLTMVLWLRSSETPFIRSTLLSFSNGNGLSFKIDMSFKESPNVKLLMKQTSSGPTVIINLLRSVWHQVVIEWFGLTGYWRAYLNDSFVDEVHVPSTNNFTMTGSILELAEAFNGEMSQFALYDQPVFRGHSMMTNSAGAYFVGQCRGLKGNLIQWTDVLQQLPYNSASVFLRNGSWCMDVNECLYSSIHKCELNEKCVDLQGSYSCQSCDQSVDNDKCKYNKDIFITGPCDTVHCQHNGSCSDSGTCICQSGYTGTLCESLVDPALSCDPNPCLNGGLCSLETSGIICQCQENWTGKYCQVSYAPSCELSPCVNNGSCIVALHPDWKHYKCICPELGRPLGANCEFLAICDTLPCLNGGRCVNLDNQRSYHCACPDKYTGQNCERYVTTSPVTNLPTDKTMLPSDDFCRSVDCHNGGSCIRINNGFLCKCQRDFKGQYCEEQRLTETKKFQVTISLLLQYDSRFNYDTTFQEKFRLQIHHVFANATTDQKMYVIINDIRKGNSNKESVLVDFTIFITFYLDSIGLGSRAIQNILIEQLLLGKLGSLPASFDDFHFESLLFSTDSEDVFFSDKTLLYVMVILLIIITTSILVILLCRHSDKFSRVYNEIAPLAQTLICLQQHIVKSLKLQSNKERKNNAVLDSSKEATNEENGVIFVPR